MTNHIDLKGSEATVSRQQRQGDLFGVDGSRQAA